jgi:hypothetical protein
VSYSLFEDAEVGVYKRVVIKGKDLDVEVDDAVWH